MTKPASHWALLVAGLYLLALVTLTVPAVCLAFAPKLTVAQAAGVYATWGYWLWLVVMVLAQLGLLAVPVRVASRRPVSKGSLFPTLLVGGLMAGALVVAALFSVYELGFRDHSWPDAALWAAVLSGLVTWCLWTVVFYRVSRKEGPRDALTRQCRTLFEGSILELLVAVPMHIIVRQRDYCCAGFMTFIGLTMGISVMLFSFGPAVFFLFVERWQRLHPESNVPPPAA